MYKDDLHRLRVP